ncbi:type III-B CRISPR module RAMP protein Cmr4 [Flectobacillus major]|uniref:type III-B CRISPR module RAMP protein Cmr4 n=1 Tax=Flectobacillus major TaxID=103 RepID=UPI000418FC27|nr:type III-B CRISPR module RAMP protein Cmr4 [Flectobacillus major]
MYQNAKPLFFICETPLHAGSGSDLGIVDLPIQRERHTSFPKIESSSLKGAIRQAFESVEGENTLITNALFGTEDAGNDAHAGALAFTDARLLLFPVKSMKGVFAWITCSKVLQQFERDMKLTNTLFNITGDYQMGIAEGECLLLNQDNSKLKIGNSIVLEEYAFTHKSVSLAVDSKSLQDWLSSNLPTSWENKLKEDIVILSNDDFTDFVNLSTEVITRIGIDNDKGTVKNGALFTEEFLPAETVMYSMVMAAPIMVDSQKKDEHGKTVKDLTIEELDKTEECKNETDLSKKVMNAFVKKLPSIFQIGGGATLGKGIVKTKNSNT